MIFKNAPQFPYDHWSRATLSSVNIWMGDFSSMDRQSAAIKPSLISSPLSQEGATSDPKDTSVARQPLSPDAEISNWQQCQKVPQKAILSIMGWAPKQAWSFNKNTTWYSPGQQPTLVCSPRVSGVKISSIVPLMAIVELIWMRKCFKRCHS